GFEYALYVNPDADLDARYRELYTKATGAELRPADALRWAADARLVLTPFSSLGRVWAPGMAAEGLAKMESDLGKDRAQQGVAGRWLLEHALSDGERLPLGERLKGPTLNGYDMKLYLAWLEEPAN